MKGDHHVIVRVVSKGLIPLIILYAFYVHFHGDYSPGGGFQAGVIFAAAFILHALIFGVPETLKAVPAIAARITASLGLALYVGTGVWAMFNGGDYLDYDFLVPDDESGHAGQHLGILVIELGVLMAVAGSMLTIFYAFAGRVAEIRDEDW